MNIKDKLKQSFKIDEYPKMRQGRRLKKNNSKKATFYCDVELKKNLIKFSDEKDMPVYRIVPAILKYFFENKKDLIKNIFQKKHKLQSRHQQSFYCDMNLKNTLIDFSKEMDLALTVVVFFILKYFFENKKDLSQVIFDKE